MGETGAPDFSDIDSFVSSQQKGTKSDFDDIDSFVAQNDKSAPVSQPSASPSKLGGAGGDWIDDPATEEEAVTRMKAADARGDDKESQRMFDKAVEMHHYGWRDLLGMGFGALTAPSGGGESSIPSLAPPMTQGLKEVSTPGQRGKGALRIAATGTEALTPLMGPAAIENPASILRGLAEGEVASQGAGYVAKKAGVDPEKTELIKNLAFWAPGVARSVIDPEVSAVSTPEAKGAGVTAFGGKVRAGVGVTPEQVAVTGKVGPFQGRINIPRGSKAAPALDANNPIEGQVSTPQPPIPQPSDDPIVLAAGSMARAQASEQQAKMAVAGVPPQPPPPPPPPPQVSDNPGAPPTLQQGHITPEDVEGFAKAANSLPPAQRAAAVQEAHGTLSKVLLEQGAKGPVVLPSGKLAMVKTPEDAQKIALDIINSAVDDHDKAQKEIAKNAAVENKPESSKSEPAPTPVAKQPSAIEQALNARHAQPDFSDVDDFVAKNVQSPRENSQSTAEAASKIEGSNSDAENSGAAAPRTGREAFQKGDRVTLQDGTPATVIFTHPSQAIVRVKTDDGTKLSTGISKIKAIDGARDRNNAPRSGAGSSPHGIPTTEHMARSGAGSVSDSGGNQRQPQTIPGVSGSGEIAGNKPGAVVETKTPESSLSGKSQEAVAKKSSSEVAPGKVGEMKVSDLKVAPNKFQYKLNTDAQGTGTLLKEQGKFNHDLAGAISVWKDPADGKFYVVNGHHRYELAKRTGEKTIGVRHIAAPNATAARSIGAMQNIAEGRGTPVDAAKFIRDTGISAEHLKEKGISLGEATAAKGVALSKLDETLFNRVVKGDLSLGRAVAIGESTDDPAEQKAILSLVEKKEAKGGKVNDDTLKELIRMVKGSEKATETTGNLFGTQEITRSLALEKAEVSAHIKQQLSKDKKLFGFVAKEGRAEELKRAGNKIDVEKSKEISSGAAQAEEVYNKLSSRGGPISAILDESARQLADGENAGKVKSDAYARVRKEVSNTLGSGEGRGAGRPEGTSEPAKTSEGPASKSEDSVVPELFRPVASNLTDLEKKYDALGSPKYVSADKAKELLPQWADEKNRGNIEEGVHPDASKVAYELFHRKLEELRPGAHVLLVTGPVAAGKTTSTLDLKAADLTYEVNLSSYEKSTEHIDAILAKGAQPNILYVHTTPELSAERRALRALQEHRPVNIDRSVSQHLDLPKTLIRLAEHYRNKIKISIRDNSKPDHPSVPVEKLSDLAYSKGRDELLRDQQARLDQLRDNGTIPEELHRQLSTRGNPGGDHGRSGSELGTSTSGSPSERNGSNPASNVEGSSGSVGRSSGTSSKEIEPTLPGMEHVPSERAEASAEQQGKDLTAKLTEPPKSIEAKAGEIEQKSPLFRDTEANPQKSIFDLLKDESGTAEPGKILDAAGAVGHFLRDETENNLRAKDLQSGLYDLESQYQADVLRAVKTMQQVTKDLGKQAPKDFEVLYHHLEDPDGVKLTPQQDTLLDDTILPFMEKSNDIFTKLTDGGLPAENYVHRVVKNKGGFFDRILAGSKGTGRGNLLQKSTPQQKHRTMMALEAIPKDSVFPSAKEPAKPPKRLVVAIKGGKVTSFEKGVPTDLGGLRSGLTTKEGELHENTIRINREIKKLKDERRILSENTSRIMSTFQRRKNITIEIDKLEREREAAVDSVPPEQLDDQKFIDKQGREWRITQATSKEIEANTDIRYHHNALASALVSYLQLRKAERGFDFLNSFKSDPDFKEISFKSGEGNPPDGWKTTDLPQFRGYSFEPHTAEVLDWYNDKLKSGDPNVFDNVGRFMKMAMLINPIMHPLNVGAAWTVEKGVVGALPHRWMKIGKTGWKAIKAVWTQNGDFVEALDAGAPLQSQREDTTQVTKLFFEQLSKGLEKEEPWALKAAKAIGFPPATLVKGLHWFSSKAAWLSNDIFFLQSAYEKVADGLSLKDALKETGRIIPQYRPPTRMLDSRVLGKVMTHNWATMFGAYHYDLLKSFSEIAKSAVGAHEPPPGQSKAADVTHGWSMLAMLGLISFMLYPALDELAKKITGNKDAKVHRAGPFAVMDNILQVLKHEKTGTQAGQSVVTPNPLLKGGAELYFNREMYSGRQIYDPQADSRTKATQLGRYLLDSISSIGQMTHASEAPDGWKKFGQSQVGVTFPKHGAEKIAQQIASSKVDTKAWTEQERETYYAKQRALDALRKGDSSVLEDEEDKGNITAKQAHELKVASRMTPLQQKIHGFTYSEVLKVYEAADADQKEEIEPVLRTKRRNLLLKGRSKEIEAEEAAQ